MREVKELVELLKEYENSLRLGLLIALYYVDGYVTFTELQRYLEVPKSTLHDQLQALKERGLVEYRKAITVLGVRTVIRITEAGRREVEKYKALVSKLK